MPGIGVGVRVAVGGVPVTVGGFGVCVDVGVIGVFVGDDVIGVFVGVGPFVAVKTLVGVQALAVRVEAYAVKVEAAAIKVPLGVTLMGMLNKRVRDDCEMIVSGLKDGIKFPMAMIGEYCACTCTLTR